MNNLLKGPFSVLILRVLLIFTLSSSIFAQRRAYRVIQNESPESFSKRKEVECLSNESSSDKHSCILFAEHLEKIKKKNTEYTPKKKSPKTYDGFSDKVREEFEKKYKAPESSKDLTKEQKAYLVELYKQDSDELKKVSRDAKYYYNRACKADLYLGCFREGLIYVRIGNLTKGNKLIAKACKNGIEDACNEIKRRPKSEFLMWFAIIAIGIAVLLVARLMFQEEGEFQASEAIGEANEKDVDYSEHGIVLKYSRPFFKRYVSPIVSSMKSKKKIREKYKHPLAKSGLTKLLTADDFFSFKIFLILGFPLLFLGVRTFLEETWPLTYIVPVGILGFYYPNIWIKGKVDRRQKEIMSNLPFAVDMLALSVESGLDFIAAMTKVIEKAKPSALTEEFSIVIREIKIGAARSEALRNLAWRIDNIQISSLCATLIAADSVGASIGPILKGLSGEIRQKRSTDVEKMGATAATKILFPMMVFILPSVMIIVAAPIMLDFITGGK